ncbi:MAG: ribonuclease HII [Bizionia sp.]|nr:ribonuclease HII [Bizionia sp.]
MKNIYFSLLSLFILAGCQNASNTTSLYDSIPENASVILHINDKESLTSNLKNNSLLADLADTKNYKKLPLKLAALDYLNTTERIVLSLLKDTNDSLQFTFATKYVSNLFKIDSLQNHKSEQFKISNYSVQKITYKNEQLYAVIKDSIAFAASTQPLLEAILKPKEKSADLDKIIKATNTDKSFSMILNHKQLKAQTTLLPSDSLFASRFTHYSAFDTEISQDHILLNGITMASDSTNSLINVFKNTKPQDTQISKIAPSNCDYLMSFTFDSFATFKLNLEAFNTKKSTSTTTLFDNIVEVGVITESNNTAVVLNSIDVISTKDALISAQTEVEEYRQVTIYGFDAPTLFADTFSPLIGFKDATYYCHLDQFFVFSNSIENLQNIIANYQNKTTLSDRDYYNEVVSNFSDQSSLLQMANASVLKSTLEKGLGSEIKAELQDYKLSGIQYIYDGNFAHVNAIIKKNKAKAELHAVTEQLNIKLDNDLLNTPQFVINHRTKEKEIVVQDIKNKLYLISNTGNILWKKQLKGPVLGSVEQIDVYKNGRLQLVFATPNHVYAIARDGKDVDNFPMTFKDKITQPLSVFDYDNNKKYRLFVTQGANVLLYDASGKTVKGFKFTKANGPINYKPQHIRLGNKDYILVKTDAELHILSRRGTPRVTPKTKANYSDQGIYEYNNTFTTTTQDGKLISIDQNGGASIKDLGLNGKVALTTTTKTMAAQSENKLRIRNNALELDFGNYTPPKILYINNKIYVSITDLQAQKVLLFDSQGKSIDNFPVYGNSTIELDNIDKDNNLEFITKGESNSILLYEIN